MVKVLKASVEASVVGAQFCSVIHERSFFSHSYVNSTPTAAGMPLGWKPWEIPPITKKQNNWGLYYMNMTVMRDICLEDVESMPLMKLMTSPE